MTDGPIPLLDLFYELRQRNFPLGASDYITALTALVDGPSIASREDLIFMCQLVWAKSPDEQKQVAETLAGLLPKELTEDELNALNREDALSELPAPTISPELESKPSSQAPEPTPAPLSQKDLGSAEDYSSRGEQTLTFTMADRTIVDTIQMPAVKPTWHLNPYLDFVGSLPVTKRQMKRAWRYYRRMRRTGPPAELDVQATIEEIYQRGVFLKPVLIPRRQNQARILVLIDEQGSMVPFRRITEALMESAKQSGLARASILFFHDVPGGRLFYDPWLNKSEAVARVLPNFMDAGVLLISDGGAARGDYDPNRLRQTKEFIEKVRRYTPHVVWLNPTPRERWPGATAGAIREECAIPMFELDRAGLDAAVNIMKGSGH
jgi:uncharacterized protein with von Willebrand factor type A (vWA) domain